MSNAILSACGYYRYSLSRDVMVVLPEHRRTVMFIGVNPSTADAERDDATIRKMKGFAECWGYSQITVGNVFAWRATDVRELRIAHNPVGEGNGAHLRQMMANANLIVPCWGDIAKVPPNLRHNFGNVADMLEPFADNVRVLGTTKWGDPRHPLMLGYNTRLERWESDYE